mgnify:CR=1 FL=1
MKRPSLSSISKESSAYIVKDKCDIEIWDKGASMGLKKNKLKIWLELGLAILLVTVIGIGSTGKLKKRRRSKRPQKKLSKKQNKKIQRQRQEMTAKQRRTKVKKNRLKK